jgi:hypothetical protein
MDHQLSSCPLFQPLCHLVSDLEKRLALWVLWIRNNDWYTLITIDANLTYQGNLTQERHLKLLGHPCSTTVAEDFSAVAATSANVVAHILDNPEHRNMNILEHFYSTSNVKQRDILRGRHNHSAGKSSLLY